MKIMEVYIKMEIVNPTDVVIAPEGAKNHNQEQEKVEKLFKIMKRNQIVKVPITELKKVGENEFAWILNFDGILGAIRFERSGLDIPNQMKQFVGQEIYVKIINVKQTPKGTVVTADRKSAIQEMSEVVLNQLKEGQVLQSVVKGVGDHTVHVDIGGGCIVSIPRKEATISKARRSLKGYFNIGDQIQVKVLKINKTTKFIKVSHAATQGNPWQKNKYNKGDVVITEIVNIVYDKTGVKIYAEVKPGLEALLIYNIPTEPKIGDKIQGEVHKFEPEKKQLRVIAKTIF